MRLLRIRPWRLSMLVVLTVLFAVQLVPYGHARTNPPVVREPSWDSPGTRALARAACFDCHSNETEWPSYSRVAPASWLIQRDVDKGRAALNFSEWQRPQDEADEAAEKVLDGEMPLPVYSLMHGHGRLSDAERAQLARGLALTVARPYDEERAGRHERRDD